MPRRKAPTGTCHLCGEQGRLSFEHIPPKAAFNDRTAIVWKGQDAFELGPEDSRTGGRQQQGGIGKYTLCARCNNNTGSWYGSRFVAWCYQAMEVLIKANGRPSLLYLQYLFPLAILKQIATMFFSVNSQRFREAHPELIRFVLDRERKYLPPKYHFYVYYTTSPRLRYAGVSGRINFETGRSHVFSEFTYPPFGYVLNFDPVPPDGRLFDISHFARYDCDEFVVQALSIPVLQVVTAFPGDYRTKEEVLEDARRNEEQEKSDLERER